MYKLFMTKSLIKNSVAILDLPDIDYFSSNPFDALMQVITSPLGVLGYILILFALIAITYNYTKRVEAVGIFVVLYGTMSSMLYPVEISVFIMMLGVGTIFGSVLWKALFKERGEY